jgi:OOP family OmpA-OmpF porin
MKQLSRKNLGLLLAIFLLPLSQQSFADSGWYVGGSLGKTYVDENIDGIQFTADGTSFRLSGGYEFNDYFGVEASYLDLGTLKDTVDVGGQMIPVAATAYGYSLAATGRMPMGQRFAAKGRVGYYFSEGQTTIEGITEDDPSEKNPFVGLGLAFSLAETVRLSFDVDYMDGDNIQPLVATVSLSIHF